MSGPNREISNSTPARPKIIIFIASKRELISGMIFTEFKKTPVKTSKIIRGHFIESFILFFISISLLIYYIYTKKKEPNIFWLINIQADNTDIIVKFIGPAKPYQISRKHINKLPGL